MEQRKDAVGPFGGSCYFHPSAVAVARCGICSRPLCSECASKTSYPHVCQECYPSYYEKKMRSWHSIRRKGLTLTALIAAILISVILLLPVLAYISSRSRDNETEGCARIYLSSSDIYPLGDHSFRVYLSNDNFRLPGKELELEVLILKNGVITNTPERVALQDIPEGKSIVYDTDSFGMGDGSYSVKFILWQRDRISVTTMVSMDVVNGTTVNVQRSTNDERSHPLDDIKADTDTEKQPLITPGVFLAEVILVLLFIFDAGTAAFFMWYRKNWR